MLTLCAKGKSYLLWLIVGHLWPSLALLPAPCSAQRGFLNFCLSCIFTVNHPLPIDPGGTQRNGQLLN
jgi:hypothetical protein